MGKFARSWELMKASAGVLRSDKSLLVFPLLSGLCSLVVMASFLIPVAAMTIEGSRLGVEYKHGLSTASWTLLFAFYLVQYFVIIFFNTALAGVALKRLRGEQAGVSEGLALAGSRFGAILGYALIAATVGLLLRMVQERLGLIGRFIVGLVGLAWTVATFLVVPVLAGEGIGPVDAVKRSVELLRRTWGENLIGNAGLSVVFGLIGFLLALASVALVIGAFATQSVVAGVTAIAIVALAFIVLALVQSSLQGIYAAALYRYAEEGEAGAGFPPALLEQAFRTKG
ncbi:MAG: hypothetical protein B7X39_00975 [Lysobacterales bacterium 14-68-21]|jgi:hypothetical protein|nr:MAG: hypothetical protein B7X45_02385 [Xanthomonadales bacterium 15-68-25]OZB68456.1 MAG: hypothetical protein B7X39_00975 [Xanthomonadales bacterium 14-68-21]